MTTTNLRSMRSAALVFDLDGILVDSVSQHVLAWHHALLESGIELSICEERYPQG
ncbi:hypothetical protein [Geminicoccus flavidas]|uniref:hypothetical protein n=1 Tax=Geminicoccus flavidas TaxID=2506407 RepID=UPI00190F7FC0|nr:hypothetical protein [Geminicoccus flavidas]